MSRLHIEGLGKRFGDSPVLEDVSLEVAEARLVAILGASGSGKTTLLRLVCGFEQADTGTIRIDGRLVSGPACHVKPEQRHIGYVAQDGALFPHLSVAENIVFGLKRADRRAGRRVDEMLEMVGLPLGYATRPPQALSGGEQQRVALARALAPQPGLILLDEPFSALDAALRLETRQLVATALAQAGATALLVTHDQSEALSMGHRVAVLRRGRLVQMDTPRRLYQHPADAELASFVGEAVLLPGLARQGSVLCRLGRLTLAPGLELEGPVTVLVRPEQIRLAAPDQCHRRRARVREVAWFGQDASVGLHLPGSPLAVTARVPGYRAPAAGDEVAFSVEGEVVAYPGLPAGATQDDPAFAIESDSHIMTFSTQGADKPRDGIDHAINHECNAWTKP